MTETAAIYARVSTADQDVERQLEEARGYLADAGVEDVEEFPEVVSGATTADERGEYDRLREAIAAGRFDMVVVVELSRLSRLGATEVLDFIEFCLDHDTGVVALDVGLEIRVGDPELQQVVYRMIASIMGSLAELEHKQKLKRVRSGIQAAQRAGKWTGRPPRGFTTTDDGFLRVEPSEFLHAREAVARVDHGESVRGVAEEAGIPESTLRRLVENNRDLYLAGEADDERVAEAVAELGDLEDLRRDERGELEARIRAIVREEVKAAIDE